MFVVLPMRTVGILPHEIHSLLELGILKSIRIVVKPHKNRLVYRYLGTLLDDVVFLKGIVITRHRW